MLNFINLFVLGMILAYARYRTASLWLPIGLYAGWLFVRGLFHGLATISENHLSHTGVFIGTDQQSGILPLCFLFATGLLVHVFVQISSRSRESNDSSM